MRKYERDLQEYIIKLKDAKKEIINNKMCSSENDQKGGNFFKTRNIIIFLKDFSFKKDSKIKTLTEEVEELKQKNHDFEILLKNVLFEREIGKKMHLSQQTTSQQYNANSISEKNHIPPLFTAALQGNLSMKTDQPSKKRQDPNQNEFNYKYYRGPTVEEKEVVKEVKAPRPASKDQVLSSPAIKKTNTR